MCEFLARESVSSSPIVRIFGKGKCKFVANFSATKVTSLPSISLPLSLYLSLSPKVHHTQYRKRIRASYIVREVHSVREREIQRERDGSDVTIVALKLAMSFHFPCQKFAQFPMCLHFPLPKIRTIGDEFTLSLAKHSHFSFLPSPFPSLPSLRGHHSGAEKRKELTLSLAKKFCPLVPTLSNGASRATSDRKSKTKNQVLPSPIMLLPSKK